VELGELDYGWERSRSIPTGERLVAEIIYARKGVPLDVRTASLRQFSNWPRPCLSHPIHAAIGSARTFSTFRAFGRSTIRIPSLRVVLTLKASTKGGRSRTRKIRSARDSQQIIFPFCSSSFVSRLPEIAR